MFVCLPGGWRQDICHKAHHRSSKSSFLFHKDIEIMGPRCRMCKYDSFGRFSRYILGFEAGVYRAGDFRGFYISTAMLGCLNLSTLGVRRDDNFDEGLARVMSGYNNDTYLENITWNSSIFHKTVCF